MLNPGQNDINNNKTGVCPCCGRCPTCGRGGFQTLPVYPIYPNYPVYPWPNYPWTNSPIITYCNTQPHFVTGTSSGLASTHITENNA